MVRALIRFSIVFSLLLAAAHSAFAFRTSAWIPSSKAAALTSLQANVGTLSESNPIWYSLAADGSIVTNSNGENPVWRAAMTGTRLVPTIQNRLGGRFDGQAVAALIAAPESRDAHASALASLVLSNAYDGIDIDYERLPAASRADFTAFLTALARRLHALGKTLSVTVEATTSAGDNGNGLGAEDWQAIGALAESVKIIACNDRDSRSAPGPIAPLEWIDRVASVAESTIPSAKIVIGLPWYGDDWNSGGATANVSYESAMQLARANGAEIGRDPNGEATFTYGSHTVFFQDATSFARKVGMLRQRHPSIGGIAARSAGDEDPHVWSVIRAASSSPSMAPPPADFTISGPAAIAVRQGASSAAVFRLTPIDGFDGTAAVSVQAPAGFAGSVVLDSAAVAAGDAVRLSAAAARTASPGTYTIALRFASGTLVHTQNVTVTVQAAERRRAAR